MTLTESRLKDHLYKWLSQKGYEILDIPPHRGRAVPSPTKRGPKLKSPSVPDVYARRHGQNFYYYIEAKGGEPNVQTLYGVLGEIVTKRVATTPARYAIALPKAFSKTISKHLQYRAWKNLGGGNLSIYILLVDDYTGQVLEFSPTRENYKEIGDL